MGEGGWDLQAVVRGCTGLAAQDDLFSSFSPEILEPSSFSLHNLASPPSDLHELEDFCRPFISKTVHRDVEDQKQDPVPPNRSRASLSSPSSSAAVLQMSNRVKPSAASRRAVLHTPNARRRKNQQKKVICHVPADKITSDLWAWRKYGQKPIKGSPFPRGYYKCSSSKGCVARKQVERSPVDPGIFIITYTAEHNHPIPIHRQKVGGGQEVGADLTEGSCNATSSSSPPVQKEDDGGGEEIVSEEETEELKGTLLPDLFGGGFQSAWLASSATAV